MTENDLMAFLDGKAAPVPVQTARALGSGEEERHQAQGGQTHEVTRSQNPAGPVKEAATSA